MGATLGSGKVVSYAQNTAATVTKILAAHATATNTQTSDIKTVTVGKTLFLVGYRISLCVGAGAYSPIVTLKSDDGQTFDTSMPIASATIPSAQQVTVVFPSGYMPQVAAGQKIQIAGSGTGGTIDATIFYFEA